MLVSFKTLLTAVTMMSCVLVSQQALAHAHLASATPAGETIVADSPKSIVLTFTESIEPAFSGASISAKTGESVVTGKAVVDSNNTKALRVPIESPLSAGDYSVHWHVLSVDGHKTKGSYSFSVK